MRTVCVYCIFVLTGRRIVKYGMNVVNIDTPSRTTLRPTVCNGNAASCWWLPGARCGSRQNDSVSAAEVVAAFTPLTTDAAIGAALREREQCNVGGSRLGDCTIILIISVDDDFSHLCC